MCLMLPMFQTDDAGSGVRLFHHAATSWAKAGLLAVEHVNNGDCSLIGSGCLPQLSTANGTRVLVKPYLVDLHSWSASGAPPAAKTCVETDAEFLMGLTSSAQTNLVAAFVGGFGTTGRRRCYPVVQY